MNLLCLGMIDQADQNPLLMLFGRGLSVFMDEGGFDEYEILIDMVYYILVVDFSW